MLKIFPALAAFGVAAALLVPTASQAEEPDLVRVPYGDLNLLASFDQAKLQRRVAFAAQVVCGPADHRDVPFLQKVGECRRATIADAQPSVQEAINRARHPSVTILSAAALMVTAH